MSPALDVPTTALLAAMATVSRPSGDDVKVVVAGQTVWYDSGWRDVSTLWAVGFSGIMYVRRTLSHIYLTAAMSTTTPVLAGGWNVIATLPAGFRPAYGTPAWPWFNAGTTVGRGSFATDGTLNVFGSGATASGINLCISIEAAYAVPSSLPGTRLSAAPA